MIAIASVPWLALLPGLVWRGVAVIERCDRAAAEKFGKESVYVLRGEEHVRLWTPVWVCPLDNGETITISPWS